jgi:hypothetical protein
MDRPLFLPSRFSQVPLSQFYSSIRALLCLCILSLMLLSVQACSTEDGSDKVSRNGFILSSSEKDDLSTAGFYTLSWNMYKDDEVDNNFNGQFELQEATDKSFTNTRTFKTGNDHSTVISGRENGEYYYRVRRLPVNASSVISNTLRVTVKHHPLSRALLFFGIGALVFISILYELFRGHRQNLE